MQSRKTCDRKCATESKRHFGDRRDGKSNMPAAGRNRHSGQKKPAALEFPMEHEDSHEDYIAWLRLLKKYGCACGVNEPLLKYRLSGKGKSGSKLKSAGMTFRVYRYMGFGWGQSLLCFVSYALHGVWKYRRGTGKK